MNANGLSCIGTPTTESQLSSLNWESKQFWGSLAFYRNAIGVAVPLFHLLPMAFSQPSMLIVALAFNLLLALLCLTLALGLLKLLWFLRRWGETLTHTEQQLQTELSALQLTLTQQTQTLDQLQTKLAQFQQQWRFLQQWLTLLSILQGVWRVWRRPPKRSPQSR